MLNFINFKNIALNPSVLVVKCAMKLRYAKRCVSFRLKAWSTTYPVPQCHRLAEA